MVGKERRGWAWRRRRRGRVFEMRRKVLYKCTINLRLGDVGRGHGMRQDN